MAGKLQPTSLATCPAVNPSLERCDAVPYAHVHGAHKQGLDTSCVALMCLWCCHMGICCVGHCAWRACRCCTPWVCSARVCKRGTPSVASPECAQRACKRGTPSSHAAPTWSACLQGQLCLASCHQWGRRLGHACECRQHTRLSTRNCGGGQHRDPSHVSRKRQVVRRGLHAQGC